MDFVKKHYEKILLSVVLVGLLGALVFLPVLINSDQQAMRQMAESVTHPKATALAPPDLGLESNVFDRLKSPYKLDFSTTNLLFNPVRWQETADHHPIKLPSGNEVSLVVVTNITPLYLIITLDSIETNLLATNELQARYQISVERQAAPIPGQRGRRPHYASVGEKIENAFTIQEIKGTLENPNQLQLVLQLADTGERAIISKDKPFRRVDGYMADLRYDPENKVWQKQRLGSVLKFGTDEYIIVAINQNSVILSARSNQKKTTLTFSP